jgi:hypothetical protein
MLIRNVPSLGVLFDTDLLADASYGEAQTSASTCGRASGRVAGMRGAD